MERHRAGGLATQISTRTHNTRRPVQIAMRNFADGKQNDLRMRNSASTGSRYELRGVFRILLHCI